MNVNICEDPRMERLRVENLQVIFKVVERCNINCEYCYYFNMGEDGAKQRPATVSNAVTEGLAKFLGEGCRDLGIKKVHIAFHGGEPMMLKPRNFEKVCEELSRALTPVAEVNFAIQTNGTVLSEDWLELFERYHINVGVSIDGEREVHDRFRLNHAGRSTFDRTVSNLRTLVEWADRIGRPRPSTISVMHSDVDYRRQYRFLRSLGVTKMSFLLPDRAYDEATGLAGSNVPHEFGARLNELFDAWFDEDNLEVSVRQIESVMQHFQVGQRFSTGRSEKSEQESRDFQVIVAQSDGSVTVDDCFIPAHDWYSAIKAPAAGDISLSKFLSRCEFEEIDKHLSEAPIKCRSCEWLGVCGSGELAHRYSKENGFSNPSPYCEAYLENFDHIRARLISDGYPEAALNERLRSSRIRLKG